MFHLTVWNLGKSYDFQKYDELIRRLKESLRADLKIHERIVVSIVDCLKVDKETPCIFRIESSEVLVSRDAKEKLLSPFKSIVKNIFPDIEEVFVL